MRSHVNITTLVARRRVMILAVNSVKQNSSIQNFGSAKGKTATQALKEIADVLLIKREKHESPATLSEKIKKTLFNYQNDMNNMLERSDKLSQEMSY